MLQVPETCNYVPALLWESRFDHCDRNWSWNWVKRVLFTCWESKKCWNNLESRWTNKSLWVIFLFVKIKLYSTFIIKSYNEWVFTNIWTDGKSFVFYNIALVQTKFYARWKLFTKDLFSHSVINMKVFVYCSLRELWMMLGARSTRWFERDNKLSLTKNNLHHLSSNDLCTRKILMKNSEKSIIAS